MRKPAKVLARVQELHDGLKRYSEILGEDEHHDEAEELRHRLSILYGELDDVLNELEVPREYIVGDQTVRAFETALSVYNPMLGGVTGEAVDMSRTCLEFAIGRLRKMVAGEDYSVRFGPPPRSFWYLWLLVGLAVGWFVGRNQGRIVDAFRSGTGWQFGKIAFVVLAIAVGAVSGNLFAALVSQYGWRKTFADHRRKATIYAGLILICALITTVVVVRDTGAVAERPDIGLTLVHPTQPVALWVLNNSKTAIMRDPKYSVGLWNLDAPPDDMHNPLPIPTAMNEYIRPDEGWGPNQFIGMPSVLSRVKKGDRIFGFVVLTCPDCIKTRQYFVYIKHEVAGWYSEVESGAISLEGLAKSIPGISKDDTALDKIIPPNKRVPIHD